MERSKTMSKAQVAVSLVGIAIAFILGGVVAILQGLLLGATA
jgi:ABC-type nitrate/sulfonate/bicarbonate transport system permease component